MKIRLFSLSMMLMLFAAGSSVAQGNLGNTGNLDLSNTQVTLDPSTLQGLQSSIQASPILSDNAKSFLADVVVAPPRQNSDYLITIPLNLSGINWRVDKVVVTCYVWDGDRSTTHTGSGNVELDVPSMGVINQEVSVPVFWAEEATYMPTQYQCLPMLKADDESLPAGYSDTNSESGTTTAPYWAQVDDTGQNSWITVDYSFWGLSGTERFIGVEGSLE